MGMLGELAQTFNTERAKTASTQLLGDLNAMGPRPQSEVLQDPNFQALQDRFPEQATTWQAQQQAIASALKTEDMASITGFFTDLKNIGTRLESDDLTGAMSIAFKRRAALGKIQGAETDDIDRIIQRMKNEDFDGVMSDIDMALETAANAKIPGFEAAPPTILSNNEVAFGDNGEELFGNRAPVVAPSRERGTGPDDIERYIDTQEPVFPGITATPDAADTPTDLTALTAGLPPEVATRATAAYRAAGEGSSGMTAFNNQVELSQEGVRREGVPQALSTAFPRASQAELAQLQARVDSASSVESGMSAANTLREEQVTAEAGRGVKARGIELVDRILANTDLNAVLGSRQGASGADAWAHKNDPGEVNAIIDIGNLRDILTADNLKMMTGILSETDLLVIANVAGGGLNRQRDEATFRSDVMKIREALMKEVGADGPPVASSTSPQAGNSGEMSTATSRADSIVGVQNGPR